MKLYKDNIEASEILTSLRGNCQPIATKAASDRSSGVENLQPALNDSENVKAVPTVSANDAGGRNLIMEGMAKPRNINESGSSVPLPSSCATANQAAGKSSSNDAGTSRQEARNFITAGMTLQYPEDPSPRMTGARSSSNCYYQNGASVLSQQNMNHASFHEHSRPSMYTYADLDPRSAGYHGVHASRMGYPPSMPPAAHYPGIYMSPYSYQSSYGGDGQQPMGHYHPYAYGDPNVMVPSGAYMYAPENAYPSSTRYM